MVTFVASGKPGYVQFDDYEGLHLYVAGKPRDRYYAHHIVPNKHASISDKDVLVVNGESYMEENYDIPVDSIVRLTQLDITYAGDTYKFDSIRVSSTGEIERGGYVDMTRNLYFLFRKVS